VFQEKRLRDQGTDATRSEQPGQRGDQVDNKNGQIAHRRIVAGWEILRNHGRNNNSPCTGQNLSLVGVWSGCQKFTVISCNMWRQCLDREHSKFEVLQLVPSVVLQASLCWWLHYPPRRRSTQGQMPLRRPNTQAQTSPCAKTCQTSARRPRPFTTAVSHRKPDFTCWQRWV